MQGWQANKKTHLCVASSIRAVPENEIPPAVRVDFFLINRKGKFIEPTVYTRRYKAILKEIGVRDVKFHTTRHTFATRALEIGMDIKTLSEILGHASPTVTLNIYAHSLPEHKAKEMDRLGKMYNPS